MSHTCKEIMLESTGSFAEGSAHCTLICSLNWAEKHVVSKDWRAPKGTSRSAVGHMLLCSFKLLEQKKKKLIGEEGTSGSLWSNLLLIAELTSKLDDVIQGRSLVLVGFSQGQRSHGLSGHLFQCCTTLMKEEIFPSAALQLVPIACFGI